MFRKWPLDEERPEEQANHLKSPKKQKGPKRALVKLKEQLLSIEPIFMYIKLGSENQGNFWVEAVFFRDF